VTDTQARHCAGCGKELVPKRIKNKRFPVNGEKESPKKFAARLHCKRECMKLSVHRTNLSGDLPPLPVIEGVEVRPLDGWMKGYAVGDDGSVWSCRKAVSGGFEDHWTKKKLTRAGQYLCVNLKKYGRSTKCDVHALVLLAFVGPCPAGMECRHFPDNSGTNNRLTNLQWAPRKINASDRKRLGSNKGGRKLTRKSVRRIRLLRSKGWKIDKLADEFGVTACNVSLVTRRKTWRTVA
jgi:hypothetical protein